MIRGALALATLLAVTGSPASATPYLERLATTVRDRLEAASLAHPPKLVPPVPIVVTWKPVRIGSLDLGAPLVALVAADLDGDRRGELYAVTAREVIAFGLANGKPAELGRVAFTGDPAVPAPRDVVGAAVVEGDAIVASVSSFARASRVRWRGKSMVAEAGPIGFPTCRPVDRSLAQLAPGRNYFADGSYAARCRDLVDPKGAPLRVRAVLSTTNKLAVTVERCTGETCQPLAAHDYASIGVAFELADVDRDGKPEVIVAGAGAPGDIDAVKVMTFPDEKPVFRKAFTGGVVGIAAVDDGPGGQSFVIAAVRLVGATRVDLWRLD
jgi:hypothetical protein